MKLKKIKQVQEYNEFEVRSFKMEREMKLKLVKSVFFFYNKIFYNN